MSSIGFAVSVSESSSNLPSDFPASYLQNFQSSIPTYRYIFYAWFCFIGIVVTWSLCSHFGGAFAGAVLTKFSIKRFTWGRISKQRKLKYSPTFGQLAAITALFTIYALLSTLGPDSIVSKSLFGSINYESSIKKSWSTAGNRLGILSYGLLPLCVSLGLKQWPYNLLATPFLVNYHFDKTAILHRWSGRLIWLLSSAHVATWSYKLAVDKDPLGGRVYSDVILYWRFQCGCIAYIILTLLVLLSLNPLRKRYYELFYWSHIVLLLGFFTSCLFHYEPLQFWCIACLMLWGAERATRFIMLCWINDLWISNTVVQRSQKIENKIGYPPRNDLERTEVKTPDYKRSSYFDFGPGQNTHTGTSFHSSPSRHGSLPSYTSTPAISLVPLPPAGYAFAQMLPGKTIRLTVHTPRPIRWLPGQHIFLQIPSISTLGAHPYTILSIDERGVENSVIRSSGAEFTLLIKSQKGFSKDLWNKVVELKQKQEFNNLSTGVNLRAIISNSGGSAGRISWEDYSSVLIVAGGTGVTHAVAILTYLCRRRREEKKGFKVTRIRFVWILREYAHLAWVATELRRCLEMMDEFGLQIDLHVTTTATTTPIHSRTTSEQQGFNHRNPVLDDLSSYENMEELPALDSVTELVLFDGESSERGKADVKLSTGLEAEGKIRRAKARKSNQGYFGMRSTPIQPIDSGTATPMTRSNSESFLLEGKYSPLESPNPLFFLEETIEKPELSKERNNLTRGCYEELEAVENNLMETKSFTASTIGGSTRSLLRGREEEGEIQLSKVEEENLNVIAEIALVGHPRLDLVLQEELSRAEGKMMVTTCGPSSLSNIVRFEVSKAIDLEKIWNGDQRGIIDISCEDFSF